MVSFSVAAGEWVHVDTPSRAALLAKVETDLSERRSFAVATLNLDHLTKLRGSADFRRAYARTTHIVADGNPIVWLSRVARRPVTLATGSDLIDPLAEMAARLGAPVAMLGSTEAALARAAERLEARHPGLRVVARVSPPFGFDPEGAAADACLDAIAQSGAQLCFVALGAPKQEILASRGLDRAPGCGFVSVGAGLDFIAGSQRRAPAWVRALALEWLWRMLSDPRRLAKRYLACFRILPGLTIDALRARWTPKMAEPASQHPTPTERLLPPQAVEPAH